MADNLQFQASRKLVALCNQFLEQPDDQLELNILRVLNLCLVANGWAQTGAGAFIEWGCVEHAVIHVAFDEGQAWIEIDPKAATVIAL